MKRYYSIDTPPPTVSGKLHMGHIFSYSHIDFIARFKTAMGYQVFYPIGFDDNGLPTEKLIEQQLGYKANRSNQNNFLAKCNSICVKAEKDFKDLFQSINFDSDLENPYQTISKQSEKVANGSFIDLFEKGLTYQKEAPVYWDTNFQTALAQADIEEKDKPGKAHNIIFFLSDADGNMTGETIEIMTTRPEMLPACQAVLYHPSDERYNGLAESNESLKIKRVDGESYSIKPQNLKNKFCVIPGHCEILVPIIADNEVKKDKGTGLVMCCTFGDAQDIEWSKKHKLNSHSLISKDGYIFTGIYPNISIKENGNVDVIKTKKAAIPDMLHDLKFIANIIEKSQDQEASVKFIQYVKDQSQKINNKEITPKESSENQKQIIADQNLDKGIMQAYKISNLEIVLEILKLEISEQVKAFIDLNKAIKTVAEARSSIIDSISDLKSIIEITNATSETASMKPRGEVSAISLIKEINEKYKINSLLTQIADITHPVKCSERTGEPVEIVQSRQWYIDFGFHHRSNGMSKHKFKDDMLGISNKIHFHPNHMRVKLDKWIEGVNQDWCISRNRFLGIKIPKPQLMINKLTKKHQILLCEPRSLRPLLEHVIYKSIKLEQEYSYIKLLFAIEDAILENKNILSHIDNSLSKDNLDIALQQLSDYEFSPEIINAIKHKSQDLQSLIDITDMQIFQPAKYIYDNGIKVISRNEKQGKELEIKRFRETTTKTEFELFCFVESGEIVPGQQKTQTDSLMLIGNEPNSIQENQDQAVYQVFDTWFTSSLTPQLNAKKVNQDEDLARALCQSFNDKTLEKAFTDQQTDQIQMDLRPQAHEIIRTWTFYTIAKFYLHHIKEVNQKISNAYDDYKPWKNVMLSGWCLANDGDKMSKSKGNIIEPSKIIKNEGSDAVRYWASTAHLGQDTRFNKDAIKEGKRLAKKIKSVVGLMQNLPHKINSIDQSKTSDQYDLSYINSPMDQFIIHKLINSLQASIEKLNQYEYSHGRQVIETFFWEDFCDNYIEIAKARLYGKEGNAYQALKNQYNQEQQKLFEKAIESSYFTIKYIFNTVISIINIYMPSAISEIIKLDTTGFINLDNYNKIPELSLKNLKFTSETLKEAEISIDILSEVRKIKAHDQVSVKKEIAELSSPSWPSDVVMDFDLRSVINALRAPIKIDQSNVSVKYTD